MIAQLLFKDRTYCRGSHVLCLKWLNMLFISGMTSWSLLQYNMVNLQLKYVYKLLHYMCLLVIHERSPMHAVYIQLQLQLQQMKSTAQPITFVFIQHPYNVYGLFTNSCTYWLHSSCVFLSGRRKGYQLFFQVPDYKRQLQNVLCMCMCYCSQLASYLNYTAVGQISFFQLVNYSMFCTQCLMTLTMCKFNISIVTQKNALSSIGSLMCGLVYGWIN